MKCWTGSQFYCTKQAMSGMPTRRFSRSVVQTRKLLLVAIRVSHIGPGTKRFYSRLTRELALTASSLSDRVSASMGGWQPLTQGRFNERTCTILMATCSMALSAPPPAVWRRWWWAFCKPPSHPSATQSRSWRSKKEHEGWRSSTWLYSA